MTQALYAHINNKRKKKNQNKKKQSEVMVKYCLFILPICFDWRI
jgi:hypothetical protein